MSVLANELAVPFTEILAQSITNAAELNSVLLSASEGLLFLDEIHLLHPVQQHALLQVLDKRRIFLNGGRSVQSIPVSDFTLVGATTDPDGLIQPLLDRFRIVLHLDFYSHKPFSQCSNRDLVNLALSRNYPENYIAVPAGQWRLPPGAFRQCGGPI